MEEREQVMNSEMEQEFRYFAFISYSSIDTKWDKQVLNKLENYRMPATLCSERGWMRKPQTPKTSTAIPNDAWKRISF